MRCNMTGEIKEVPLSVIEDVSGGRNLVANVVLLYP